METVLLTVVEPDSNKNQRRVNEFSTFFIKKINKKLFAGYSCQHHFPMVKLKHRHPDGSKFFFNIVFMKKSSTNNI